MDRKGLREQLCKRDGTKCHYCDIEEKDFCKIWGAFCKTRGRRLEVDHKDNGKGDGLENYVLACALCNCAKRNKLTHGEFKRVGAVIREIWQHRIEQGIAAKPPNCEKDFQIDFSNYDWK